MTEKSPVAETRSVMALGAVHEIDRAQAKLMSSKRYRAWLFEDRRAFFRICDEVIRSYKTDLPQIELVDKEKLFAHVLSHKIPEDKWERFALEEIRTNPESWQSERKLKAFERSRGNKGLGFRHHLPPSNHKARLPLIQEEQH